MQERQEAIEGASLIRRATLYRGSALVCVRRLLHLLAAVSILLTGSTAPLLARAQAAETLPSVDTYYSVIELVFGKPKCDPAAPYSILLRFLPTDRPESQILVCSGTDGRYQVTYQVTPENIWGRVLEIHRWTGREDPKEMAAKVKTATLTVEVDQAQMRRLMDRYSRLRFSPLFGTAISVDGCRYDLWFTSASNKAHYSLSGSLDGISATDPPLIKWMAALRYFVDQSQLPARARPRGHAPTRERK